jgi:tetratricopeptide (TPR) repeat protein
MDIYSFGQTPAESLPPLSRTVFLSSTSKDLEAVRARLIDRLAKQGFTVLHMAEFGAHNADGLDVSLQQVRRCDLFIGLYAFRYGYIPADPIRNPDGLSVTEMEFHEAIRQGVPIYLFRVTETFAAHDPLIWAQQDVYAAPPDDRALTRHGEKWRAFLDRAGTEFAWRELTDPTVAADQIVRDVDQQRWFLPPPPAPDKPLVGRDVLRADLQMRVRQHPRTLLDGAAGMGKTLLAKVTAGALRRHFRGGVLWASLSPDDHDPDGVAERLITGWLEHHLDGRALDRASLKPDALRGQFRAWVAASPAPMLMILDNIWSAPVVEELLRWVPDRAHVLITARAADIADRLDIPPEARLHLSEFDADEAIAMLRQRLGALPAGRDLRAIAEMVQGHPLALELTATVIRHHLTTDRDYASKYPDLLRARIAEGTGLGTLASDDPQPDVERALALSLDMLDSDLRRRFMALGALPVELSAPADLIGALVGDEDTDVEHGRERLDALIAFNLLTRSGERLVSQHAILRSYARALLRESGLLQPTEARYAEAVIAFGETTFSQPRSAWRDHAGWFPHIERLGDALIDRLMALLAETGIGTLESLAAPEITSEQVRALRDLAEAHPDFFDDLDRLTEALGAYLAPRSTPGQQGMRWLRAGLIVQRASLFPALNSVLFLNRLGMGYAALGETEMAEASLRASLAIGERTSDDLGYAALTHAYLMRFYTSLDEVERALHHAEAARALYVRIDDDQAHDLIELIDSDVLLLLHKSGQYDRVEALLPRLQAGLARSSNPVRTLDAMIIEAGMLAWRGDYARALARIAQAEEWAERHNLSEDGLYNLELLKAQCLFTAEQFDASIAAFDALIERLDSLNALPRLAEALLAYSQARHQMGQPDQAQALAQRALATARTVGNTLVEFQALTQLAALAMDSNQYGEGQRLLDEAEVLLTRLPRRGLHFLIYINIRSATLRLLGRGHDAIVLLEEALTTLPAGQTGHVVDLLEETLAQAYIAEKRFDDAEQTLNAAEERAAGRDQRLHNLKLVRANMEYLRDRYDAAEALMHDLLHADPPASAPLRSEALLGLASIRIDQGRDDEAFALLDEGGRLRAELGLPDPSAWQRTIILAQRAFQRKDYARAEALITAALPAIEAGEPPPEVRAVYRMRLAVLMAQRHWTDAAAETRRILAHAEAHQLTDAQFEKENRQLIGTLILCLAFEQGIGRVLLRVAARLGWALLRLPGALLRRLFRRLRPTIPDDRQKNAGG